MTRHFYFSSNRSTRARKALFFFLILFAIIAVFFSGYMLGNKGKIGFLNAEKKVVNTEKGKDGNIDFSVYWEAWNKLKEKSVSTLDPQKMIYDSISGLLSTADDPYTVFFTPEDNKRFKEDIHGEFDGIGVEITYKNNYPTIVAPLSKTPAEAAGLKAGDIILEVDGKKTTDLGLNGTIDNIRGKAGTTVKLRIVRDKVEEPIVVDVKRETIVVKSVEWEVSETAGKKYAHVKIRQFGDDTTRLFDEFAREYEKNKYDGIVIDLRNNPGGYLESAIDLSSYFLDGGSVVIERDKNNKDKEYKVSRKAKLKGSDLAVLVNNGSASASEIFAGAIQDRRVGKIIGEKTFGKGSVQELIELSDGSAVKITIAKWLTPNGRTINGEGINPDLTVQDDDKTAADEQFEQAIGYLKAD